MFQDPYAQLLPFSLQSQHRAYARVPPSLPPIAQSFIFALFGGSQYYHSRHTLAFVLISRVTLLSEFFYENVILR